MWVRIVLFLVAISPGFADAAAGTRIALVIGNASYAHVPNLANPLNDAASIERALGQVGFEVERIYDAGYDGIRHGLANFSRRAATADVAVIYFAGHGVEVDRQNYLIPVDARLSHTRDLPYQAVPLYLFRGAAEQSRLLSLVIVDACRNNPFLARIQGENRALSRGLARVEASGQNDLVAFAARAGTVAADGQRGNSPYAKALVEALAEPGLEIGWLFRRVSDRVRAATGGEQVPVLYGTLSEKAFYFVSPEPRAPEIVPERPELIFWETVAASDDPRDFMEYLERFPDGLFAGIARRRLEDLETNPVRTGEGGEPRPIVPVEEDYAGKPRADPVSSVDRKKVKPREPVQDASDPHSTTESQLGLSGEKRRELQRRLVLLGYDTRGVDGVFGPGTRGAIKAWQRQAGLETTGFLTQDGVAALERQTRSTYAKWQRDTARTQEKTADSRPSTNHRNPYGARTVHITVTSSTRLRNGPSFLASPMSWVHGRFPAKILNPNLGDWIKIYYHGTISYIPRNRVASIE